MTVRMLKPGTVSMVILKFSSGTLLNLSQEDYEELISNVSFYHEELEHKKTAEQFLKKSGN